MSEFNKDFQLNLLANIATDRKLLSYATANMRLEDFDLESYRLIFESLVAYWGRHHELPKRSVVEIDVKRRLSDPSTGKVALLPEEHESINNILPRLWMTELHDPVYYLERITDYLTEVRGRSVIAALQDNNAPTDMRKAFEQLEDIKAGIRKPGTKCRVLKQKDYQFIESWETIRAVSTGVPTLDMVIGYSGLPFSAVGMITACPGVGKTTTLLNFAHGAANAGYYALFITLELPATKINERHSAMAAGINAHWVKYPYKEWPDDVLGRLTYMMYNENYVPVRDNIEIVDAADGSSLSSTDVDNEIESWRNRIETEYGKAAVDKCRAVYIDWVDRMTPTQAERRSGSRTGSHEFLPEIIWSLVRISKKYDVAIWTATQGTKEADGIEKLKMKHSAWAFHKNDGIHVGLGVAEVLTGTGDSKETPTRRKETFTLKTREPVVHDIMHRHMNFSVNKNRDALTSSITIYQCPSLKLYASEDAFQAAEKLYTTDGELYLGVKKPKQITDPVLEAAKALETKTA